MAQKESHHREVIDDLSAQLKAVKRQHGELITLSRDQVKLAYPVISHSFIDVI